MKPILWLASWYPSRIAPYDGDFVRRHARAVSLVQAVHVVHVVKDTQGAVCSSLLVEESRTGLLQETIIYYKPYTTGLNLIDKLISFFTYYKVYFTYISKVMKKNDSPPLVHLHVAMRAGPVALWLKWKYALPYMITEHWSGYKRHTKDNFFQKNIFFRYITRRIFRHTSLLLPVSEELGRVITSSIYPLSYRVVPNVADTSMFYYRDFQPTCFRFVHVSSMQYEKNIPGILQGLKALTAYRDNWECVMIGPADEMLKKQSDALGLQQKLTWTGELSYREVARQLQQASAFILFSRYENLPCVLIEAACCGLPVIAPRTGGIPEIVDEQNGILIETNNEEELVQAMLRLLQQHHQYNRKKISETAAGKFGYGEIGKEIESIYKTILTL